MKKSLTIAAAQLATTAEMQAGGLSTDVTPAKPAEVVAHLLKPGVNAPAI